MDKDTISPQPARESIAQWFVRLNSQVSSWAASMSWWRLFLLFIIVMAAGGILSDQLHLQHDKVKIERGKGGRDKDVDVVIGGPDGVRITSRSKKPASAASDSADATPEDA